MAKYILSSKQKLSPTSMLMTLEPSGGASIDFDPGQYVSVRFKRHGRPTPARCFSVVNTPNGDGMLQLGIRVEGKFTTAFSQLATQSEVYIEGPFGQFFYDPKYDTKSVMVAGGIGITPIYSIINALTQDGITNPTLLLYSCRSQNDVPLARELLELEQNNPHLKVVFVITDGPTDRLAGHARSGRITPELIEQAAGGDYESTSFFLCGPQGFMDAVAGTLRSHGTPDWRINMESFIQAHAAHETGVGMAARKLSSVYGVSAIGFVVVMSVIFGTDLWHTAAAASPATPAAQSTSSSNSSTTTPTIDTSNQSSSDSSSTSDTSTTNDTSTQQPTTQYVPPTTTQTYQRPVSNVS